MASDAPEMIERVARALAVEDACDPDFVDTNGRVQWTYHIGAARAAIEAMREPTEAMMRASRIVTTLPDGVDVSRITTWGSNVWPAMIDASLTAPEPPAWSAGRCGPN